MAVINSVLGPLDTANLGFTLMHEHILVATAGIPHDYPELLGQGLLERAVQALVKAKEGGIDTIVDATTFDLGRDAAFLAEVSRRSGVNIIACTGWWLDIPRGFAGVSVDQFARLFVRDIKEGIAGTNVKAAILKGASDVSGVLPGEETILRALAKAHHETGAPIILHSYPTGQVARQQLAILKQEGIDLRRVSVDHSNDTTDVEYLTWILDQGCYLGLDRYPGRNVSPQARTRTMKALIDLGYANRLMPSHDWTAAGIVMEAMPQVQQEREIRNPYGYLYMKKVVFAQLREMGIPEAAVNSLCRTGPRNFLEGV